jgi:hypothetical protein
VTPYEEALLAVVREAIAPFEADGRARIEVEQPNESHGLVVRVLPSSSSASPITIHAESDDELNLEIGRNGLATDLTGDPQNALRLLARRLDALARGLYSERIRKAPGDTVGKGRGVFVLDDHRDEFTYYNLGPWLRSIGMRTTVVSYTPY